MYEDRRQAVIAYLRRLRGQQKALKGEGSTAAVAGRNAPVPPTGGGPGGVITGSTGHTGGTFQHSGTVHGLGEAASSAALALCLCTPAHSETFTIRPAAVAEEETEFTDDFTGGISASWTKNHGTWEAVGIGEAVKLHCTADEGAAGLGAFIYYNGRQYVAPEASVTQDVDDATRGAIVLAHDFDLDSPEDSPVDGYMIQVVEGSDTVRLLRLTASAFAVLDTYVHPSNTAGVPYGLKWIGDDGAGNFAVEIYVNGVLVDTLLDPDETYAGPFTVGLGKVGAGVMPVHYDNFSVDEAE